MSNKLNDNPVNAQNIEPVAHFYPEGDGCTVFSSDFAWKVQGTTEPIPLYLHPAKTLTDEDLTLILEVLIYSYDDTNRCYLEYEAIWKNSPTRKAKLDGMKRMVNKHTHAIEKVEAILRKANEK